ncbi:putative ATP-dependent RNA helicase spindle-E [Diplonema papillatum]|nr:putative ATP-dependent RNA helicase spindle-E [Diplonema papillatum]
MPRARKGGRRRTSPASSSASTGRATTAEIILYIPYDAEASDLDYALRHAAKAQRSHLTVCYTPSETNPSTPFHYHRVDIVTRAASRPAATTTAALLVPDATTSFFESWAADCAGVFRRVSVRPAGPRVSGGVAGWLARAEAGLAAKERAFVEAVAADGYPALPITPHLLRLVQACHRRPESDRARMLPPAGEACSSADSPDTARPEENGAGVGRTSDGPAPIAPAPRGTGAQAGIHPAAANGVRGASVGPVTIVQAPTGSGKTTLLPYALLQWLSINHAIDGARVVVATPRRLAAAGAYDRVVSMAKPHLRRRIGYKIAGEARNEGAALTFATTGSVLKEAVANGLRGYTHVFVDEYHERSVETDLLCFILKRALLPKRLETVACLQSTSLHVILMSATTPSECGFRSSQEMDVRVVDVPGRPYAMTEKWWDEWSPESTAAYPQEPEAGPGGGGGIDPIQLVARIPSLERLVVDLCTERWRWLHGPPEASGSGTEAPGPAPSAAAPEALGSETKAPDTSNKASGSEAKAPDSSPAAPGALSREAEAPVPAASAAAPEALSSKAEAPDSPPASPEALGSEAEAPGSSPASPDPVPAAPGALRSCEAEAPSPAPSAEAPEALSSKAGAPDSSPASPEASGSEAEAPDSSPAVPGALSSCEAEAPDSSPAAPGALSSCKAEAPGPAPSAAAPDAPAAPEAAAAPGAILVFLPGIALINAVRDAVCKSLPAPVLRRVTVVRVHSALPDERATAARPAAAGEIRVLLATNAAELGVTLPDIDVVVDSCLEKAGGGALAAVSRASAVQRAGRTGRTRNGTAYRLLLQSEFPRLAGEPDADMSRAAPVAAVLAMLKYAEMSGDGGSVAEFEVFECLAGSPAEHASLHSAIRQLEGYGAVERFDPMEDPDDIEKTAGLWLAGNEHPGGVARSSSPRGVAPRCFRLTDKGRLLQSLPFDPVLANFVVFGVLAGCGSLCLEAAAAASATGSCFVGSASLRLVLADGTHTGLVAAVNALRLYAAKKAAAASAGAVAGWCEELGFSQPAAEEALARLREVSRILAGDPFGWLPPVGEPPARPVTHAEAVALNFAYCCCFAADAFAYRPPPASRAGFPAGCARRHTVELTADGCRAAARAGNTARPCTPIRGQDPRTVPCDPNQPPLAVQVQQSFEASSSKSKAGGPAGSSAALLLSLAVGYRVARVRKGASGSFAEFSKSTPFTVWGRPVSVWNAERLRLGHTHHRGKLTPVMQRGPRQKLSAAEQSRRHPPPRFAPVLLSSADVDPPVYWPPAAVAVASPLIFATPAQLPCGCLPCSIPGLFPLALLLGRQFTDHRGGKALPPSSFLEAVRRGDTLAVEGSTGLTVDCEKILRAFPPEFFGAFESLFLDLHLPAASYAHADPDHGALASLLSSVISAYPRPDNAHQGFAGTASVWSSSRQLADLFSSDLVP